MGSLLSFPFWGAYSEAGALAAAGAGDDSICTPRTTWILFVEVTSDSRVRRRGGCDLAARANLGLFPAADRAIGRFQGIIAAVAHRV